MPSKKVKKLAEDIKKLSPAGQALVGAVLGNEDAIEDVQRYGRPFVSQSQVINAAKPSSLVLDEVEDSSATIVLALEEMTKNNAVSIQKLQDEIKEKNQMLKDSLTNDVLYKEAAEKVKEAQLISSGIKKEIMKVPAQMQLAEDLKTKRAELKERKAAISDYLLELQRLIPGTTQLELFDGEVLEIQNSAKLVKRLSR